MPRTWIVLAVAAVQVGCATIVSGGDAKQRIRIDSVPQGATATLGGERCETPCSFEVPRKHDAVVELSLEGHEPLAVRFRSRLGAATLGNLLLSLPGIVIGIPIDVVSGTAYHLVPSAALLPLVPAEAQVAPAVHPPPAASPSVPRTIAPLELSPLPPRRLAVSLEYGGGGGPIAPEGDVGTITFGLVGTLRVAGPFAVGAAARSAAEFALLGGGSATETELSALVGVAGMPSRSSRVALLLQAGGHRIAGYWGRAVLPQAGVRAQCSAVMRDRLVVGGWATVFRDLRTKGVRDELLPDAHVGGTNVALGVSFGALAL